MIARWNKTFLRAVSAVVVCCSAHLAWGEDWRPEDRFLEIVRQIESSGGKFLYGDGGRSLGDFQMSAAAWTDVNTWRKSRGIKTYSYRPHVFNSQINRAYAGDYMVILRERLIRHIKREPTPAELYAAYNMGFTAFRRCGFDLNRVNRTTARKCQQITAYLQQTPRPELLVQRGSTAGGH
jgi:hypothetical protein